MNVNGHDKDSTTRIEISDRDGKVVWKFSKATQHIVLDPQNAFEIAEGTARAAHTAKFGTALPNDRSYIAQQVRARLTEELRDRMVVRTMHVIRSLQEIGKSPEFVAKQLVDTIFSEVFS